MRHKLDIAISKFHSPCFPTGACTYFAFASNLSTRYGKI